MSVRNSDEPFEIAMYRSSLTPLSPSMCTPMHLSQRKQNIVYKRSHHTSAIYQHSISNNLPSTNISHLMIIGHDNKQVEHGEAIHIRINNPALNYKTGTMNIPEIFNKLLGADGSSNESNQMVDSDHPQGLTHLTVPSNRFPRAVCLAN